MKSSREQFEEWFSPRKIAMQKSGISTIRIVRLHKKMLEAWQASRAAIEVELPDKVMVEDEFDDGHNCAIDYCADAIRAVGLTVKGES